MTQTPVIYEVNLTIARRRLSEFDAWLTQHVEQMLDLPGFVGATTYDIDDANEDMAARSVHYTLRDQAALDHYFEQYAERMRADGVSRFGPDLSASRRVLGNHQRTDGAKCRNCAAPLAGQYCAECGQRHRTRMISLWEMLRDVFEDAFSWDSRMWRSLRPLLFTPGKLTSEYLGGRRMYYTPPLRMYLVLSIMFFLLSSIPSLKDFDAGSYLNFEGGDDGLSLTISDNDDNDDNDDDADVDDVDVDFSCQKEEIESFFSGIRSPVVLAKLQQLCEISLTPEGQKRFNKEFTDLVPKLLIVMLPFTALAGKIIYLRSRRYYVEHLLFYTHVHSFIFLLLIVMMGVSATAGQFEALSWGTTLLEVAIGFYIIYYFYRALRNVFGQGRWMTIFKMFLIGTSYTVGASALALIGIAVAALLV